ncbi:hypothetical protein Ndes2526B_g01566 [Nannochloris sp. 'desiccata']|nr:hypothetical protein KSW81_005927 [Chlorella desiccata (nom. nud.)]KAH7623151.1 hypothetical protein NADE_002345 [Chlorella desiccata (nom. nud.)]
MLAWRGGRRRLVREQKARRKLEGVFNAAAKLSKPVSRPKKPATIEDLDQQFRALRTKPNPEEPKLSGKTLQNSEPTSEAAEVAEAAQASPQNFRALPAFPSLGNTTTARTGVSLDILAIQGAPNNLNKNFKSPAEENEKNLALKRNRRLHPPSVWKTQASAATSSKSKQVSEEDKTYAQIKRGYQFHTNTAMVNDNNDVEPMCLEL